MSYAVPAYNVWVPVTPSDGVDLPGGMTLALWVGGAGNVSAMMQNLTTPTVFLAVPAGTWLPLAARRITATGTTATGLVALYQA